LYTIYPFYTKRKMQLDTKRAGVSERDLKRIRVWCSYKARFCRTQVALSWFGLPLGFRNQHGSCTTFNMLLLSTQNK
jgi:hypothetical protein